MRTTNTSPILTPSSTNCIAKQILVIAKLNGRKDLVFRGCVYDMIFPSKAITGSKLATEAQE